MSVIAVAQATAGDRQGAGKTFAAALEAARRIDATSSRAKALSAIAKAQATAGNFADAMKTAMDIELNMASPRAFALAAIAKELVVRQ